MTMKEIAQHANVNKNAIYYHFDNMFELGKCCINDAIPHEFAKSAFIGMGFDDNNIKKIAQSDAFKMRTHHLSLVAGPHASKELTEYLKQRIVETWLDVFDVDKKTLSRENQLTLRFLLGGVMEILGTPHLVHENETLPLLLLHTPLVRSMIEQTIQTFTQSPAK